MLISVVWYLFHLCMQGLVLLTLSTHAHEGYSCHFVCLSVTFLILEKAPFSGLNPTSV